MFARRLLIIITALSILTVTSNTPVQAQGWQLLDNDIFVRDLSRHEIKHYLDQGIKNNPSLSEMLDVLSTYNLTISDMWKQGTLVGKMIISKNKHRGGLIVGKLQNSNVTVNFVYVWSSEKTPQAGLAVRQINSDTVQIFEVEDGTLRTQNFTLDAIHNFTCTTSDTDNSTQLTTALAKRNAKCSGCLEACNFLGGLHCTITAAVLCTMVCGTTAGLGCPVGCAIAFYLFAMLVSVIATTFAVLAELVPREVRA